MLVAASSHSTAELRLLQFPLCRFGAWLCRTPFSVDLHRAILPSLHGAALQPTVEPMLEGSRLHSVVGLGLPEVGLWLVAVAVDAHDSRLLTTVGSVTIVAMVTIVEAGLVTVWLQLGDGSRRGLHPLATIAPDDNRLQPVTLTPVLSLSLQPFGLFPFTAEHGTTPFETKTLLWRW